MKKTFAVLMLAAMLFSAGCGNTMDGAKKDAQDAAAKVEQTANDAKDAAKETADAAKDAANATADAAKDAANATADAAKDAANATADVANATADAAKDAAANAVDTAVTAVSDTANAVTEAMSGRTVSVGGLIPGATKLEDIQAMFGEATNIDGNVMTFVNDLKVTLDDAKQVKTISTTSPTFDSGDGVYVGDADYALNDYCGPADAIRQVSDGVEYEYNSGDKKSVVIYKAQNGIISEITCTLK